MRSHDAARKVEDITAKEKKAPSRKVEASAGSPIWGRPQSARRDAQQNQAGEASPTVIQVPATVKESGGVQPAGTLRDTGGRDSVAAGRDAAATRETSVKTVSVQRRDVAPKSAIVSPGLKTTARVQRDLPSPTQLGQSAAAQRSPLGRRSGAPHEEAMDSPLPAVPPFGTSVSNPGVGSVLAAGASAFAGPSTAAIGSSASPVGVGTASALGAAPLVGISCTSTRAAGTAKGKSKGKPPIGFRPPPGLTAWSWQDERESADCNSAPLRSDATDTKETSGETDSFDEEMDLLRCQADLVEAAAELGTTSADDELLTTDPDLDDEEDGVSALVNIRSSLRGWKRPTMASVVIEEDSEGVSSGLDEDVGGNFDVDGSEMRSRLWAQSLLRLKRSIDEIYSLCEYESDEVMCGQVRGILDTASQDFISLTQQFQTQQEYALLPGEFPFKTGVAWTTRTPKASKMGESALEVLERAQLTSPSNSVTGSNKKRRSSSLGPQTSSKPRDEVHEVEDARVSTSAASGGTGDAEASESRERQNDPVNREDHLQSMVHSALHRIQSRLGRPSKPDPEDLQKRIEDKQRRSQQLRAEQEDQRLNQLRQLGNRVLAAKERRTQREQQMQCELLEKMTRARRQYQDHLRLVCQRARKENRKAEEVAYITKEALKSEREITRQKHENARLARTLLREQMRKKLIESANRVAKVSEKRRRQQEMWQQKVLQDLEEKELKASQRRKQHINTIKMKSQHQESRSETVREKRRELQEEDERSTQQQQQDFVDLRGKNLGRMALNVEGLPDGAREEVAGQVNAAVQQPSASSSASRSRVSTNNRVGHKSGIAASARCQTPPPPTYSFSCKSSPKSDGSVSGVDDSEVHLAERTAVQQEGHRSLKSPKSVSLGVGLAGNHPEIGDAEGNAAKASAQAAPAANAGEEKHILGTASSDGDDDDADMDGDATDAGEATNVVPEAAANSDSMASGKLNLRPKSKADPKDAKQRRATSPADPTVGQQDGEQHTNMSAVDGQHRKYLEALRCQLSKEALQDDEALKMASESAGTKAAATNAAHRARISKLATDLGRVIPLLGNSCTAVTEDTSGHQSGGHSLDLERADAVLSDFCKVLDQSQREADYALVLHLGCAGKVIDICSRIKDSIGAQSGAAERTMPPAKKQLSTVMLSALKWLGLLSKQRLARVFLLLTNRVVLLADVAVECLATTSCSEPQSMPFLFLPQVLHILFLHVKQTLPDANEGFRQTLISYLLVCGLSEKLRDLFRGAGVRGMRLFEGASPVPLLLMRAMCFLSTLVGAYRPPTQPGPAGKLSLGEERAPVLQVLRKTDLFGIVSVLATMLLEGRQDHSVRLPHTVLSLAVQAVRILNSVARIHLETLQETLTSCQQELYHLMVALLDYCAAHQGAKPVQGQGQDESELLHETISLLGYFCLLRKDHQRLMCFGEGQTLLTKITSLPLHYFMDDKGKLVLFPTILSTCFRSEQNLELLRSEMKVSLLKDFLVLHMAQKDDGRQSEVAVSGFGGRFPFHVWQEALTFFSQ